jgi:hypothetical protein
MLLVNELEAEHEENAGKLSELEIEILELNESQEQAEEEDSCDWGNSQMANLRPPKMRSPKLLPTSRPPGRAFRSLSSILTARNGCECPEVDRC